jgi:gas vesicle protein
MNLTTILLAVIGAIAALFGAHVTGRVTGAKNQRNEDRAKEADAYEDHLEDIERAASARSRVQPSDGVPDDRYRRD